ncbi:MAG: hypothetical protein DRP42_01735 [Tenericutes bacterium]|nr:MAG: hypothetical protein DRP42_01735 [Mycoplasmatota bacterium]
MFLAEGAKVSKENGIHEKQTIIGDNGDMFTFENGNYQGLTRKIREVGDQYIELSSDDKIDTQVIEERVNLAKDGIVTIGLIINPQTKRAISNVDIQLKGVVFIRGQEKLLKTLSDQILDILRQEREGTFQIPKVIARIKKEITKELRATIKKAPDLIIKIEELK